MRGDLLCSRFMPATRDFEIPMKVGVGWRRLLSMPPYLSVSDA